MSSTLFATSDSPHVPEQPHDEVLGGNVIMLVVNDRRQVRQEKQAEVYNRDFLEKLDDSHIRRDRNEASTWDFFVHTTRIHPMGANNPILEAASGWDFGQQYWNEDGIEEPSSLDPMVDIHGKRIK